MFHDLRAINRFQRYVTVAAAAGETVAMTSSGEVYAVPGKSLPAIGRAYILFLTDRASSAMRAIKILPADEKHLSTVKHALHR